MAASRLGREASVLAPSKVAVRGVPDGVDAAGQRAQAPVARPLPAAPPALRSALLASRGLGPRWAPARCHWRQRPLSRLSGEEISVQRLFRACAKCTPSRETASLNLEHATSGLSLREAP